MAQKMDAAGAFFMKTVGVVPKTAIEEAELAVAALTRGAKDPGDLRNLLEHVGLVETASKMARRRSA